MPAAGGVVPGEHPLGVMVAAVGPVILETLPIPLVRVVGEGDPPGAVVGRGAQFVVPIAGEAGTGARTPFAGCCAAADAMNPSAASKSPHSESPAPNRTSNLSFISISFRPRGTPPTAENAHTTRALHRIDLCGEAREAG